MNNILPILGTFGVAFLGLCFFSLLLALPVALLWNLILPSLLGIGYITFLKAWGLVILCRLLTDFSFSMNFGENTNE